MNNNQNQRRLIPFRWLPASWGLKGRVRQEAEAAYYLEGEELTTRLEQIRIDHLPHDHPERQERELKDQLNAGVITQMHYEKNWATVKGEPWVTVVRVDIAREGARHGNFELDWNDLFVKKLEEEGYGPHPEPEQIVNQWFTELCRNVALEEFDGVADYSEKLTSRARPFHDDVILKRDLDNEDKK